MIGAFTSASAYFRQAKERIATVDASVREEIKRQCTAWTNKAQIELNSTRTFGDINQGAYLYTKMQ